MFTTLSLRLLSSTISTLFLVDVFLVYQNLKQVSSTFFVLYLFHFISWTQRIFTHHLIMVSTTSQSLPVSYPTFQVHTCTILGSTSFLTLHIHRVKCEYPCSFFTTPGWRCNTLLMMWWLDPCSLNTISRSRYGTSPMGWRPGPYPFNTILRFWYDASIRGLRHNNFSCDFIFIEMAKTVVSSSNLTQPLLIYPDWISYVRPSYRLV
jgi:hypothetical protein